MQHFNPSDPDPVSLAYGGRSRRMRIGGESLPLVETGWA